MYSVWFAVATLSAGQVPVGPPGGGYPAPPAVYPSAVPSVQPPAGGAPAAAPGAMPRLAPVAQPVSLRQAQAAEPAPLNVNIYANLPTSKEEENAETEEESPPDRWAVMRTLQGTWLGAALDDHRTSISGWVEQSFTGSTAKDSNFPVVWNDRANKYLLNQFWTRIDRSVVTSGTTDPTWGYRLDLLYGTDYRFSLPRGLLNSQLESFDGNQNLYGIDPIQFYANIYFPTVFNGMDIRAGRLWTPFGYESLEAVSTPFVSRSYAFNYSPPFTHMGVQAAITFNAQWAAKVMLANGNDVFIDPSQEPRVVGNVTYTHPNAKDVVTFGYSLGRGKFNAGDTFAPVTGGLPNEPAGRNNINVLDLVWIHTFNPKVSWGFEAIYGYQTNVPANVVGGLIKEGATTGTAHWGSIVNYLNVNVTERLTWITRFEVFDDFEGQRTGFEGVYTEITTGFTIKPVKDVIIRPEIRWDNNNYSAPFEGKQNILTAAIDVIVRW